MKYRIEKIFTSRFTSLFLLTLLILNIILLLFSTIHRYVNIDDAWLGEYAYWQSKLGYVKSELMRGITLQEIRLICHHKFHTLQGALFIRWFGFSVYSLKSISLIYFIIFLISYFFFAFKRILSANWFYLSLLLILSNALIFDYSFVFRPEIPMMTIGFLSYICLDSVLQNNRYKIVLTIAGGLLAGLCTSTHLNGIIFIIAGGLILFINRKFWLGLLFGFSAIPTFAIYFYDFTSVYNLKFWLYQLNESPAIEKLSDLPAGLSQLFSLLSEHLRFFHSPIEITFSLLLIVTTILAWKNLKSHKNLVLYASILVISMGLIAIHKTSKYAIIYIPYLILILTTSIRYIYQRFQTEHSKSARNGLFVTIFLLIAYFSIHSFYNVRLSSIKFNVLDNRKFITCHIKEKTDSCRIIAPMTFIFNEIHHFKSIQSDMCFSELQKSNKWIYKQGFLEFTKTFKADYIILTPEYISKFGLNDFSGTEYQSNGFEVIYKADDFLILKNIDRYLLRNPTKLLAVF